MAFNFNWSPLIADTTHARDMLTAALNKSPKPPIIVDDIVVSELNLGSTPPELEILEVGDLAEDRFRGIFKMSYAGDAFLTLRTRVQANPLNTYLSTKSSFASPQPLAAASGLTIPISITLSDIRLSGFVILVFSRQKGLTIVFRNDPLESLKVSSTFDSIPFIKDYLQREIEAQLRVLFMEDLPAILHRLSLKMFCPDYADPEVEQTHSRLDGKDEATATIDPLASPPQNPIDWLSGNEGVPIMNLGTSENHATFSTKNLLRLAALTDSHRTLSLFTPSMRDTVFRAWAGPASGEYGEPVRVGGQPPSFAALSLSRMNSSVGSISSAPSENSESAISDSGTISSRPSLASFAGSSSSLGMGSRPRTTQQKKRKRRVINLRKTEDSAHDVASSEGSQTTASTPALSVRGSSAPSVIAEEPEREREEELETPPVSPENRVRFRSRDDIDVDVTPRLPRPALRPTPKGSPSKRQTPSKDQLPAYEPPAVGSSVQVAPDGKQRETESARGSDPPPVLRSSKSYHHLQGPIPLHSNYPSTSPLLRSFSSSSLQSADSGYGESTTSGGILEQAWMNKMAAEIARKVRDEKAAMAFRDKGSERYMTSAMHPPPAYDA